MKILHVTPTYLPATRYGGPIRSVHGVCKALVRLGHEVEVATTPVDGTEDSDVPLCTGVDVDGVAVNYFPTGKLRRIYRSSKMKHWLDERCSEFDVIHTHSMFLWPGWAAGRTAISNRVPLIISPRGMLDKSLFRRKRFLLKTIVTHLFDRPLLEQAASIHVCSRVEKAELENFKFNLRHIEIIENGLTLSESTYISQPFDRGYFLFVGRISWKKRLPELISALGMLENQRLIIVGNDEEGILPQLQCQVRKSGLSSQVDFVGEIVGDQKRQLLSNACALVVPSLAENFGNVVIEAMGVGTPVITTPGVGASELLEKHDCGIVCGGSAKELAGAMAKIVSNPYDARNKGRRGLNAVKSFYTWERIAARFEHLYQRCVC